MYAHVNVCGTAAVPVVICCVGVVNECTGGIDLTELVDLLEKVSHRFPHTAEVLKKDTVKDLFRQVRGTTTLPYFTI